MSILTDMKICETAWKLKQVGGGPHMTVH